MCAGLLFWKWKSKESCTCSSYQPVESSFQHSFNYSVCSFAWLRQASLHAANQILSHTAAFLCHRLAWSPISRRATLHRSPISYSKGGRYGSPPLPLPPLLVRCPAFIDHKSTSLAELIVNHPQWHYWSGRSLRYRPALSPRPTSQPDCGVLIPLRYSIEGSLLIIHLLCCNFIFFPVHTVVTGSPYGGNLVNKRTAFCAPRHAGLTDVALSYSWLVAYFSASVQMSLSICSQW